MKEHVSAAPVDEDIPRRIAISKRGQHSMPQGFIDLLACPQSGSPLVRHENSLVNSEGQVYPMCFEVPILVPGAHIDRQDISISEGFLDDFMSLSDNPERTSCRDDLAEVYRTTVHFDNTWLDSEASMFLSRVNGAGQLVRSPFDVSEAEEPTKQISADATPKATRNAAEPQELSEGQVRVAPLVAPQAAQAGKELTFNLIIHNDSHHTLMSSGEDAIRIEAVTWQRASTLMARLKQRFWDSSDFRATTDLLIDLGPSRSIAQPVRVSMPKTTGPVTCHVRVMRGERKLAECQFSCVLVSGKNPLDPGWGDSGVIRDYNADHLHAYDVMETWLAKYGRGHDGVLVELGGNFSPMLHSWPGLRFNMDIDAHGMFTHKLLRAPDVLQPDLFMDIVGDGMRPPFRDGAIDAIAMFATFHHFPDPIGLLKGFRPKLADDGLLMLLCEPYGHVFVETGAEEYVQELERGAYEQSFHHWEYARFADDAGYDVIDTANDSGSVKIALRPRR